MSTNEYDAKILSDLIDTTIDSVDAYAEAAVEPADSTYAEMFRRRAAERRQVVSTLRRWVRALGGELERQRAGAASLQRKFPQLPGLRGSDRALVAAEIERGEAYLQARFKDAMRNPDVSPTTRLVIADVYASVNAGHEQMRGLRRAAHGPS